MVEVGGEHTLGASIDATRAGGTIALVGGLSGGFGARLEPFALAAGAKRLVGVLVGHRRMAEDLARFVSDHRLRPVVAQAYDFADLPKAFADLAGARHVGKLAVRIA